MDNHQQIYLGSGSKPVHLELRLANRHGLIAGATGTGKTISLRVMAEAFSRQGIPVFITDVKGDLGAIGEPGERKPAFEKRAAEIGLEDYRYEGFTTQYWDVLGKQGLSLRATPTDMGPLLLARMLDLNETQSSVLQLAFHAADEQGLLLLDLKDLRALLQLLIDHAREFSREYGSYSKVSVGAIQRKLLTLEQQGAKKFFGEPALQLEDLMQLDAEGKGVINLLAADELMQQPKLYSTFLLWLVSELFEELPEIGDPDKPRLVLFFDEAHLLFKGTEKIVTEKLEQVVRLIRSKGVGVYFVTQTPADIPDGVLGQLGNRIQHALRAFTPKDRKAVRVAAQTFRTNPALDTETVISELGIGEALVSTLQGKGTPSMVQRVLIRPPASKVGPISKKLRAERVKASTLFDKYSQRVDRQSAHEQLLAPRRRKVNLRRSQRHKRVNLVRLRRRLARLLRVVVPVKGLRRRWQRV